MSLRDIQIGYIAGLYDGETSLQIEKREYKTAKGIKRGFYPSIRTAMKSPNTIQWLHNITGVGTVYPFKDGMVLHYVYGDDVMTLLELITPYLINKKPEAELIMEFIQKKSELNEEEQHEYFLKLKRLKKEAIGKGDNNESR